MGRSLRIIASVLSALARTGADSAPEDGTFDCRALQGRPTDEVIAEVVDHFCPPEIIDDAAVRVAVGEAVAEALGDSEEFDPAVLTQDVIQEAVVAVVAELVFVAIIGDSGEALNKATDPLTAVRRENQIRALVREVARHVGRPVVRGAGQMMTRRQIERVATIVTRAVHEEMSQW